MGVGGGFVAIEPGGERIVARREAALCVAGQPSLPRRPGSGWMLSLASAGVLSCLVTQSHERTACFGTQRRGASASCLRAGFAAARLGCIIHGKHDKKLLVPTPMDHFSQTCFVASQPTHRCGPLRRATRSILSQTPRLIRSIA